MDLTASFSEDMGQLLNSLNSQLEVDAQNEHLSISPKVLPQLTPPTIGGKDSMECESSPSSSSSGYSSQSGGASSGKSGSGRKFNIDQIALNLATADSSIRPLPTLFNSHVSGDNLEMEIPSFDAKLSPLQNNSTDENCAELQPFLDSTVAKRARNPHRPFTCDICHLSFTQKGNLSRHKQIHTPHKPFKCDLCNYASRRKDALINHRSTHCVEKPYKCCKCSQAYKQKSSLRDHLRAQHKMSTEEIRDIIPPDFPPNVALIANIGSKIPSGGKRKASSGSISPPCLPEDVNGVTDMGEQSMDEGEAGLLPSNLSITPSPPASCASPVDTFSPIGKKRAIERTSDYENELKMSSSDSETLSPTKLEDALSQVEDLSMKKDFPKPMDLVKKEYQAVENMPVNMSCHQKASPYNQTSAFTTMAAGGGKQSPQFRPPSDPGSTAASKRSGASSAASTPSLSPNMFQQNLTSNLISQHARANNPNPNVPSPSVYEYYVQMLRNRQLGSEQQRMNFLQLYNQQLAAKSAAVAAGVQSVTSSSPSPAQMSQVPPLPSAAGTPTGAPIAPLFQQNPFAAQLFMAQQQRQAAMAAAAVANGNTNMTAAAPTLPLQSFINNKLQESPKSHSNATGSPFKEETNQSPVNASTARNAVTNDVDKSHQPENLSMSTSQCDNCKNSSHVCDTCQIIFTDEVMYTIHMGIHTKSNPLQCNICGFLSSSRYEFASHVARGDHRPKEANAFPSESTD